MSVGGRVVGSEVELEEIEEDEDIVELRLVVVVVSNLRRIEGFETYWILCGFLYIENCSSEMTPEHRLSCTVKTHSNDAKELQSERSLHPGSKQKV